MQNQILKFFTAGSVDDGKSTLIGRLLYDSKSLFRNQIEEVNLISSKNGKHDLDLALFTDGLRDERLQGITIDVAYRFFSTQKRKFIVADTPGHIQYTRNMFTGASNCNVALLLIDAKKGILEQTKRHLYIASILHIPHVIFCINKMDLVNFSERAYEEIVNRCLSLTSKMAIKDIRFVPMVATTGENVVERSPNLNWYQGSTLLNILETIHISSDSNMIEARFPIQLVLRTLGNQSSIIRYYAGNIASGIFRKEDHVKLLPSGLETKIKDIQVYGETRTEVFAGMAVSMTFEGDFDVSRGDVVVKLSNEPFVLKEFSSLLCWFDVSPIKLNNKYIIKHNCLETICIITKVHYKVNINSFERELGVDVKMNDICKVEIKTMEDLVLDNYRLNKEMGQFILIDTQTNNTIAAGMFNGGLNHY